MEEKKLTDKVVVAKNAITDEEIVKALECLTSPTACVTLDICEKCACTVECEPYYAMKGALDLINRQKAEIERLTEYNANLNGMCLEFIDKNAELQKQVDTKTEHLEKTLDEIDRLKTANSEQQVDIKLLTDTLNQYINGQ